MDRDKKKPLKPWEVLGIGKTTYYAWMHNGRLPVTEGVKLRKEKNGRFSGLKYTNSPERLEQIRRKYKNGIPPGEIEMWMASL